MTLKTLMLLGTTLCLSATPALAQTAADLQQSINDAQATQTVKIADRKPFNMELFGTNKIGDTNAVTISRPGASFIKVSFSEFKLPDGAYVEVSNFDGSEAYRYGPGLNTSKTFDAETGQNGSDSFSAMSISGDYVSIRLIGKNGKMNPSIHRVAIDSLLEGYSEEMIEQMMSAPEAQIGDDFSTESTCGQNERRDVQCWASSHPVEFERSRPVARLLMPGGGLCTAWRVGANNHMFTNEHCVNSNSGVQGSEAWFNYQRPGCGSGDPNANVVKVSGNTMLETNSPYDYTLFTVNNFSSIQSFGHFGLDVREAIDNEVIYIPQHGSGNPKELAIESDRNDGGLCRIDDVSAAGRTANSDMGYFCDTIGGSSGSPVLARSSNKVIALHHFGGCTNQGVKISEIWPRVQEHFGGQIPDGDNGGPVSTPPAAPSNLTADVVKEGKGRRAVIVSVDLNWTDNASNEDGFSVERCVESGKGRNKTCTYGEIADLGADSTSFSDPNPVNGARYRVKAYNGDGTSAPSNEAET